MGVSLDHVGVVVDDLEAATGFFLDLGLERVGEGSVEGEWVGNVIGLDDVRAEIVMLKAPGSAGRLELSKFHTPAAEPGVPAPPANRLGIRHLSLLVDDLGAVVERLRKKGTDTLGEVENYQDTFLLCYVRGPEGILVELAERIGDSA